MESSSSRVVVLRLVRSSVPRGALRKMTWGVNPRLFQGSGRASTIGSIERHHRFHDCNEIVEAFVPAMLVAAAALCVGETVVSQDDFRRLAAIEELDRDYRFRHRTLLPPPCVDELRQPVDD